MTPGSPPNQDRPANPNRPRPRVETEAVLFDMGGVLVELGPLEDFLGPTVPGDTFWETWLKSPTVRRFERGECDEAEFGRGLRSEFGLDIEPGEIVERFRHFPRGLFPGAADLVGSVPDGVATGVLSNTNRLHWEHQTDGELIRGLFDHVFLSYELGVVKPDEAMFRAVMAELRCEPEAVLFVDDNWLNVQGARAIGIDAHVAVGVEAARAVLDERGLVQPRDCTKRSATGR